jgi:hypothetical protein
MLKRIGKFILVFVLLVIAFMGLLTLACSFPSSWIEKNVKESADTLYDEGNRKIYFSIFHFQLREFDNYTDALMVNTAFSIDCAKPLYSAFVAMKNYIPGVTQKITQDFVGELSSSSKYENLDQVSELKDTANGEAKEAFEYARYWHGYLIFLRPLLILFNYWQIRILLTIILSVLAIILLVELTKKFGKFIAIAFGVGLLSIDYFYIGLSLQNSPVVIITMLLAIFLIKRFEKIKDIPLIFFIVGCLVAFFDLLDFPLISYGVGLIVYFLLKQKQENYKSSIKQDFLDVVKLALAWGIGYGLMWITKWILIDVIYNRNTISSAIGQAFYRSAGGNVYSLVAIAINILYMAIPLMITTIISIVILIKKTEKITKERLKLAFPYFLISLMPFAWYTVFANHSIQHVFFTYREQLLTIIGILIETHIIFPKKNKEVKDKNF